MSSHRLTINGHGLRTGDGPLQVSPPGALPDGLATGTDYYVVRVDANTLELEHGWRRRLRVIGLALSRLWRRVLRAVKP